MSLKSQIRKARRRAKILSRYDRDDIAAILRLDGARFEVGAFRDGKEIKQP